MDSMVKFEDFREEWLFDVQVGSPSTTELGHRFARKLLTQWRDIEDSSDDLIYCDGSGDGGIDIAYLARGEGSNAENESDVVEGDTWYLIQGKYGTAFQGEGTLLQEAQKLIDTLDGKRQRLSSLAEGLLQRLQMFRAQASEQDHLTLVFATELPLNEAQRRVLVDVRHMGRGRLGPYFDVESISIDTLYTRLQEEQKAEAGIKVELRAELASSGQELLIGAVSLLSLYEFMQAYRAKTEDLDQLYEKNVRRFLGTRGRVNKAMQTTLQKAPERFGLYNNGITFVVEDFSQSGGIVHLTEPYIVNGCQTTRAVWEVFHQRLEAGGTGTNPELVAWRKKAEEGVVVTKVVKVGSQGDALLQDITRYTNSQNAVREKDFLTLTSDFRTWRKQMEEKFDLYLEIQRGGWDSRKALQKQNPSVVPQFSESANASDLLKVYGAGWLGEAGTAFGKNGPFLPGGAIFQRILNDAARDAPFGVDDLFAAYKLQRAADDLQFGRGAPKPSRRQTRFLFYKVVLEILGYVLIRSNIAATPTAAELTFSLIKLFQRQDREAIDALLQISLEVIDEYLTPGTEDTLFEEPAFKNTYNNDLNSFLKWEQLGKTEQGTPRLKSLLVGTKRTMGRGAPSPREAIVKGLQ